MKTARNPITIEVIETLDAIDRRGSFAKAAEELNKATSAGRLVLAEGGEILHTTARLANKAKEVATGRESRISIATESLQSYSAIFGVLHEFLREHSTIEIDACEAVLNDGWRALEQDRVDLIVGSPGPVPLQKGYRAIPLAPVPSENSIVASNTDIAKIFFLSDTQSTHLKRWWENGEALNIAACQIRGALTIEQLGCKVGARGLDENGRAGLMTGEPGGSLPCWINHNAVALRLSLSSLSARSVLD